MDPDRRGADHPTEVQRSDPGVDRRMQRIGLFVELVWNNLAGRTLLVSENSIAVNSVIPNSFV